LRTFLYAVDDPGLIEQARAARPKDTVAYIPAENAALQGLGHVNVTLMREVASLDGCRKATLDHDATIWESSKRDTLPHYARVLPAPWRTHGGAEGGQGPRDQGQRVP
jgi:hypothetical protein